MINTHCMRVGCANRLPYHRKKYCSGDCLRRATDQKENARRRDERRRAEHTHCQREKCSNKLGPRRRLYCSEACAQKVHRAKLRTGCCVDCGDVIQKTSKRCIDCASEYVAMVNTEGGTVTPASITTMREKARAREAAARGYEVTPELIEEMKRRHEAGESKRALAEQFGISNATVSVLIRYGSWTAYRNREREERVPDWRPESLDDVKRRPAKLTDEQVIDIVLRVKNGGWGIQTQLAKEYGVSVNHIHDLSRGRGRTIFKETAEETA